MNAIVVEKSAFEDLFQQTLNKLELARFKNDKYDINTMHRAFHYEVCQLKDRLERNG